MIGRRLPDNSTSFAEGDYAKRTEGNPAELGWYLRPPGCHLGRLGGHTVTEHEDGTITVSPSILQHDYRKDPDGKVVDITWHGFLERGVWRQC